MSFIGWWRGSGRFGGVVWPLGRGGTTELIKDKLVLKKKAREREIRNIQNFIVIMMKTLQGKVKR